MIQAHRFILSSRLKSYPCKYHRRAVFLSIIYLLLFWQHDMLTLKKKKALWEQLLYIKYKREKFSLHLGIPILWISLVIFPNASLRNSEMITIICLLNDSQCFYCVRSEQLRRGVYDMGFNTPSKIQETALPMLLADPSVFIFLLCCCTVFYIVSFKG